MDQADFELAVSLPLCAGTTDVCAHINALKAVLKYNPYQAWWHMTIIPALGGLRQKDQKFIASLGYIEK